MEKDFKLAVCYFMPEKNYIDHKLCIPIQLGPKETGLDLGIQKDDEGNNRSDKHSYYSEYSGIYWLWKNTTADYKGMFHHRRFMTTENESVSGAVKNICKQVIVFGFNVFRHMPSYYQRVVTCYKDREYFGKVNEFLDKLPDYLKSNDYDVLVPKRYIYYHTNVFEAFDEVVNRAIMKELTTIFEEDYKQYLHHFKRTLRGRKLYYSNIHVMRNEIFNEYCSLVFGVFDHLEDRLITGGYYIDLAKERSLSRVYGYIGELIMNTFLLALRDKGGKIKELALLFNASASGNENINWQSMRYNGSEEKEQTCKQ